MVADPPAPRRTIFLVRTTSARGDRDIEGLVRAALDATARLKVVGTQAGAALIGKLVIRRRAGALELDLEISQPGKASMHLQESVAAGESVIDGAMRLAASVAAPPPAPGASGAGEAAAPRPRLKMREPSTAPEEDARDWRSPFDSSEKRLDFVLGLDLAEGLWSADPAKIISGSDTGFDFNHYAPAFTRGLDGRWHPAFSLHGGLMFLGAGALELAWSTSRWSNGGSATLVGARLTGYPFPGIWPARWFDLGLEFGAGTALIAGNSYDMTGGYLTLGLSAEVPLRHWLGVTLSYRLIAPFLKHFYIDDSRGLSEPTSGVWFYSNAFALGLNFHPSLSF
jgi:hypothetical protein